VSRGNDLGHLRKGDWGKGIVAGIVSKFEAKTELIFFAFFLDETMQINP
jgi:hypothetical protein